MSFKRLPRFQVISACISLLSDTSRRSQFQPKQTIAFLLMQRFGRGCQFGVAPAFASGPGYITVPSACGRACGVSVAGLT